MALNFTFYTDTYHGNRIAKDDWARLSLRAVATLEYYERIWTVGFDPLANRDMAICAIAEEQQATDVAEGSTAAQGGSVASVRTGSVAVTYDATAAANIAASHGTRVVDALRLYAIVYRGVSR